MEILTIFFVLTPILIWLTPSSPKNYLCNEKEFFKPYVRVSKTKKGPPITELGLEKSGFVDVSMLTDATVCINGPAILYTEVEITEQTPNACHERRDCNNQQIDLFKRGGFKIYIHECFNINRLTKNEILERRSKSAPSQLSEDTGTTGSKTYGISLISAEDDYRKPTARQFSDPKFGFRYGKYITQGSSFAVIGNSEEWCTKPLPVGASPSTDQDKIILYSQALTDQEICFRSGENKNFDKLFHEKNFCKSDFDPMENCAPASHHENSTIIILDPTVHDLFATLDEAHEGSATVQPIHPAPAEPDFILPSCETNPDVEYSISPTPGSNPLEDSGTAVLHTWRAPVEHCINLPNWAIEEQKCSNKKDNEKITADECDFIYQALNLTLPAIPDVVDELEEKIKWKKLILNLVDSIFVRICPHVPSELAPTVSRLLYYYLYKLHERDPDLKTKRNKRVWDFLRDELLRCRKNVMKIPMIMILDDKNPGSRNIQHHNLNKRAANDPVLSTVRGRPYIQEIIKPAVDTSFFDEEFEVRLVNSTESIFYYEEAADFLNLNPAIDLHWKVFSTVAGFCNSFYYERKAETFPRLYSNYYDDMFAPVVDMWTHSLDSEVLDVILSEFITDRVTLWLDSCLEASYIVSDSPTYRPPRPVLIDEGSNKQTNYFTHLPPHAILIPLPPGDFRILNTSGD